ncbi:lysozyme [Sphingobacterium sp. UBA6645]|uniref:lysozyme n=1 Tax=Sphingobacterium sp. UBA6645 TaxID=1947511 RepID=UPI0025F67016|nr:lysozyme [Sphingobacterium sp. UBA6645]
MRTGEKGLKLIEEFEVGDNLKKYLTAYQDVVGVWTIGIGSTYYEDGSRVKKGDKITEQRARELFANILVRYENDVKRVIKVALNQNQFDALVSFTYNLGGTNLASSTLAKRVNNNPCDADIRNQFMRWNKAGGKVYAGLTRRRKAEADLYFSK